ncbi:MAG: bifunctional nuclease family protein [Yaniella sp.]|uniref:bifunctional nuclease family protein n=1 Tax=Yaniella sp. TaxID=2773929 RepID=UPI0026484DFE|nr:bifunctional nuclease family protein [Yaniella sp.]MDN5730901.1 bifunctional nuclease family protein [Yaniella sp.]MDN5814971.1 bifunctional nuclease family protein [Yaniella sp.]MDN5817587.1 bifunctional nuclease family protein [Yaniella sp.]MDN5837876.1 bifunctional nuclease family protein [Yaniella sp.]MDN5888258.1 bifunctional nuclease family protein [Yaniella sp.]
MADIVMKVLEIRIVLPGNQPILLLLHQDSQRLLRLWIGPSEGTAIGLAQQGVDTPRPTTHQLLVEALETAGDPIEAVRIAKVDDEVFYAELMLASGKAVDARASDAVAAALFAGVSVYASEDVLDSAGIDLTEGDIAAELNIETPETQPEVTEESLDDFREFLKDLSPEDFLKSGEQQQTPPPFEDDDPDNGTEDNDDPGSSEK